MRQLSFYFRRSGAVVWLREKHLYVFPRSLRRDSFDAVCAGGVDSVPAVVADFLNGSVKAIYRSPIGQVSSYAVDYSLLTRSEINPSVHLIEASRGCSFKCSFCVIPSEVGAHAGYSLDRLSAAVDNAISTSPRLSFRRLYPIFMLLDNNFSDDRAHMLRVCAFLKSHPRVRGWVALVTQNVLHDRQLVRHLAASKCLGLLSDWNPSMPICCGGTERLKSKQAVHIIDDIAYAESQGISITYGYLFDPRHQTPWTWNDRFARIARNPLIPMPVYLSVIAPACRN